MSIGMVAFVLVLVSLLVVCCVVMSKRTDDDADLMWVSLLVNPREEESEDRK